MPLPLLVITGPTASGKSALALELARRFHGEIISADSMQVYRACDIVTAKPTPEERAEIPHHLIDICNPNERYSAGQWSAAAAALIEDIRSRAKTPILCGGTGFYLKALLQPEAVPAEAPSGEIRQRVETLAAGLDNGALHQLLQTHHPELAARLHANDRYRVLRGLEIAFSDPKPALPSPDSLYQPLCFGFDWPRETLYERICARVDTMLAEGALAELEHLAGAWGPEAPALGGVGYKQLRPALDSPKLLPECVETWKRDTRRYAKRQLTWFRHQLDVNWLDPERELSELATIVAGYYSA